jgi:hypothetical protein
MIIYDLPVFSMFINVPFTGGYSKMIRYAVSTPHISKLDSHGSWRSWSEMVYGFVFKRVNPQMEMSMGKMILQTMGA